MKFQPGGWNIVRTIDIPDDTKVIAVKAIDIAKASTKLMSQLSEQLFRL